MTILHVAAMPFPSPQGTQAAVRAMVDADHEAGRSPELLTYAHGAAELRAPWPHHRIADLVRDRSLRSGPSWRKLVEDAQLLVEARRLRQRLRPRATLAHHVEATTAALGARLRPLVFFAHTALGPELPTYLPGPAGAIAERLAGRAGDALDVTLARRADATVAVSPWLAAHLSARAERDVRYVPVPWRVPPPITATERDKARARFALSATDPVFLYAGNLDAYQGVPTLARAFAEVRARRADARLLVATDSDRSPLESALWSLGAMDRTTFAPLADEPDRRVAHAAADLAWVPRAAEGGLPMKLLDALSRGVPTVVTRRACSGIDLGDAAIVTSDDDPEAIAAAALLAIEGRDAARAVAKRGVDYVATAHAPERYVAAIDLAIDLAIDAATDASR